MKKILLFLIFFVWGFAEWRMFADKEETYLYNTTTGEVYVKHKKGGKNFEDVFVRMPKGVISLEDIKKESKDLTPKEQEKQQDMQLESIKKAQELMQKALETGGM